MLTPADITPEDIALLNKVKPGSFAAFDARKKWLEHAHAKGRKGKQIPPLGEWTICLYRAGRGYGKSRLLSENLWWECWRYPNLIGHYLAPTLSDVTGTIFEGPAGVCSVIPAECLLGATLERAYNKTRHEIRLNNGSLIRGFATTEQGERLRGPQCHTLCGDELAAWDRPAGNLEIAFNNAMLGCRLPYPDGSPSRAIFGTTPKPIPFLRRLEARPDVIVVRGSTYENMRNLNAAYLNTVLSMDGTQIGKQEIEGEYLGEEDFGILRRSWFRLWPADKPLPDFSFVLEVYDTAASEENYDAKHQKTDPTACIVLGVFNVQQCFTEIERKKLGVRSRYAALLCEAWSERLGFPDLLERARKQRRTKWGPRDKARRADVTLIEDKSSGRQLRQMLATWGVPCWPYNPISSKTQRMHMASPFIKQGAIFVPESSMPERRGLPRDWVEPYLEQVCGFSGPGSTEHDDFCDTTTSGIIYLRDRNMIEATPDILDFDPDEKMEREQREALKQLDKSSERYSAYGS